MGVKEIYLWHCFNRTGQVEEYLEKDGFYWLRLEFKNEKKHAEVHLRWDMGDDNEQIPINNTNFAIPKIVESLNGKFIILEY